MSNVLQLFFFSFNLLKNWNLLVRMSLPVLEFCLCLHFPLNPDPCTAKIGIMNLLILNK